jgi:hypothetical protein
MTLKMGKKCIICLEEAKFKIKDTSDYYCQECAEENFNDLNLLVTMEEEAKRLKKYLKSKMDDLVESERELEEKLSHSKEEDEKEDIESKEDVQNNTTGKD